MSNDYYINEESIEQYEDDMAQRYFESVEAVKDAIIKGVDSNHIDTMIFEMRIKRTDVYDNIQFGKLNDGTI